MNRHSMKIAITGALLLSLVGCCGRILRRDDGTPRFGGWREQPIVPRAGTPVPPPGVPGTPGSNPEVLMPSKVPPLPPSSSFLPPAPRRDASSDLRLPDRGGLLPPTQVPVDEKSYRGSPSAKQTEEPPTAPLNPFTQAKPRTEGPTIPPDLTDPSKPDYIPPPGVPQSSESGKLSVPPVDIPGFNELDGQISVGLKPVPDGFQWLKTNGYRTVLHLNKAGIAGSADRTVVESKGLAYRSIDVSFPTIASEHLAAFNAIIAENGNRPLFIYDNAEGKLTGALWYLHYRTVQRLEDHEALTRAKRLGLKAESTPENEELWRSILKLLP